MVPRYADEGAGTSAPGVAVDPRGAQTLGMRLARAEMTSLASGLTIPGSIEFNQRDLAIVQTRTAGFVQRVYGHAPGDIVAAGAPIADLFNPDWASAQTEYLAVRRIGDPRLTAAARSRLTLLGMSQSLIAAVEHGGKAQTTSTVRAPIGGVIQTLDVRAGMSLAAGQSLAQISGLATVWLTLSAPETQAGQIRIGQSVSAQLPAFPGETFSGRVSAILPATQADSRTLQVRVELANRGGRLRPGMFATASVGGEAAPVLAVPTEAVIRTGRRDLVMLAQAGGRYQPAEVRVGRQAGDRTEILAGLSAGDQVVASGQFLLDSEASLAGLEPRPLTNQAATAPAMGAAASMMKLAPTAAKPLLQAKGRVEEITADTITLSHGPVPAIGWPAMTMTFKLDPPSLARGLKAGDQAAFGFEQRPDGPAVRSLHRVEASR
ncbi:Cu(I)/Ag(I) efflux system membrane fusion protein [Caulobacter sp. BE264]|uniref:efflux RND transporter periplasmic adaptor subunit n=1 Tax=Caulobacter sp. BE264 TaxID=2817724 RepID=UPI002856844E|nr:efflux RND transporter periplasmic adaptor subunit [Caulobacter sp. BE264]MDR7232618.1 Cu(I)/Ag(I) efflux system membrane fusion protein [Caulobacter sp. BE264]